MYIGLSGLCCKLRAQHSKVFPICSGTYNGNHNGNGNIGGLNGVGNGNGNSASNNGRSLPGTLPFGVLMLAGHNT